MSTAPTTLADLSPAAGQVESKFVLDAETACVVWRTIGARLRPQHRDPARPVTLHRTTYFDTADYRHYRSDGPLTRRLRVREYATAARVGEVPVLLQGGSFAELKESANGMRAKTRVPVTPEQAPGELERIGGGGLLPCLTTWYQRTALTDAGERLRVTLDSKLVYCRPRAVGSPCDGEPLQVFAHGPGYILEVKAWDELPPWMVLLLRGLREAVGYSKFRDGMQRAEARGLLT